MKKITVSNFSTRNFDSIMVRVEEDNLRHCDHLWISSIHAFPTTQLWKISVSMKRVNRSLWTMNWKAKLCQRRQIFILLDTEISFQWHTFLNLSKITFEYLFFIYYAVAILTLKCGIIFMKSLFNWVLDLFKTKVQAK